TSTPGGRCRCRWSSRSTARPVMAGAAATARPAEAAEAAAATATSCRSTPAGTRRPVNRSVTSARPRRRAAAAGPATRAAAGTVTGVAATVAGGPVAAAGAAVGSSAPTPRVTANGGDGGPVRRARLPNGLRVVTEAMPELRSVAVGFWAGTGSRDEPDPLAGASHFLEHLLFKGTAERSAQEIAEVVEAVGGEMNAFTTKEYTAYYVRLLDENLDLALDIL